MCLYTRTDRSCGHYEDEDVEDGPSCIEPCVSRADNTTTTKKPGKCDLCLTKEQRQAGKLARTPAQIDAVTVRAKHTTRPRTALVKKLAALVAADDKKREEALKAGRPLNVQQKDKMEAAAAKKTTGGRQTQGQAQPNLSAAAAPNNNNNNATKKPPPPTTSTPTIPATAGGLAVRTLTQAAAAAADKNKAAADKNRAAQTTTARAAMLAQATPVGKTVVAKTAAGAQRVAVVGGTSKD